MRRWLAALAIAVAPVIPLAALSAAPAEATIGSCTDVNGQQVACVFCGPTLYGSIPVPQQGPGGLVFVPDYVAWFNGGSPNYLPPPLPHTGLAIYTTPFNTGVPCPL